MANQYTIMYWYWTFGRTTPKQLHHRQQALVLFLFDCVKDDTFGVVFVHYKLYVCLR